MITSELCFINNNVLQIYLQPTSIFFAALLIFIRKTLDKAIMCLQTLFSAKLLSHRQTHIRKIKYNLNVHLCLMDHVTYSWSKQNNPKITTYPELSCTSSNRTNKSDHITPVLWYLQWLPAVFRIQLKVLHSLQCTSGSTVHFRHAVSLQSHQISQVARWKSSPYA